MEEHRHHEHSNCGHDHHHHDHNHHHHDDTHYHVYILENLGCANCAAKMEKQIRELPEVEMATITFATKQLRVAAEHPEKLLPKIQAICSSIESEVTVKLKDEHDHHQAHNKSEKEHKKEYLEIGMGALLLRWQLCLNM